MQEFLWEGNKPMNYDYENVPSQDLLKYDILNFGFNIISKQLVMDLKMSLVKILYLFKKIQFVDLT